MPCSIVVIYTTAPCVRIEVALKYLPDDLFDQNTKGFLFTSTVTRDACRVARHYCQTREIILISERILPGQNVKDGTNPKARYFIYVVLHEVAHAIGAHRSPILDNLTKEECEAQYVLPQVAEVILECPCKGSFSFKVGDDQVSWFR